MLLYSIKLKERYFYEIMSLVGKDFLIIVLGLLSFIYLTNPTAGVIEIIPDNIPFIGR